MRSRDASTLDSSTFSKENKERWLSIVQGGHLIIQ